MGSKRHHPSSTREPEGALPPRLGALLTSESNIRRRVRREMTDRSWKQPELARQLRDVGHELAPSSVWRLVAEQPDKTRRITFDDAVALAAVFEIDVGDLGLPIDVVERRDLVRALEAAHEGRRAELKAEVASLDLILKAVDLAVGQRRFLEEMLYDAVRDDGVLEGEFGVSYSETVRAVLDRHDQNYGADDSPSARSDEQLAD